MKPEGLARCHQTLSSCGWGLGARLGTGICSLWVEGNEKGGGGKGEGEDEEGQLCCKLQGTCRAGITYLFMSQRRGGVPCTCFVAMNRYN